MYYYLKTPVFDICSKNASIILGTIRTGGLRFFWSVELADSSLGGSGVFRKFPAEDFANSKHAWNSETMVKSLNEILRLLQRCYIFVGWLKSQSGNPYKSNLKQPIHNFAVGETKQLHYLQQSISKNPQKKKILLSFTEIPAIQFRCTFPSVCSYTKLYLVTPRVLLSLHTRLRYWHSFRRPCKHKRHTCLKNTVSYSHD